MDPLLTLHHVLAGISRSTENVPLFVLGHKWLLISPGFQEIARSANYFVHTYRRGPYACEGVRMLVKGSVCL